MTRLWSGCGASRQTRQGSSVSFRVWHLVCWQNLGGISHVAIEQPQLPWEELPQDCPWLLPGQCGWWAWTSPPAFRGWSWGVPGTRCLRSRRLAFKGTGSAACVSLHQPHSSEIRERMILPGPADELCMFFSVSLIGVIKITRAAPSVCQNSQCCSAFYKVWKKALVKHVMLTK